MDKFYKNELLIGKNGVNKLKDSNILLIGCGGVGGFVCEGLVRAGIGNITIVDNDTVDITNFNRQIIATDGNQERLKTDVLSERILSINNECNVKTYSTFIDENNLEEMISKNFDYVVDAIDSMTSKIALIEYCYNNNIKIISSMGMGNRISPEGIIISDIYKTSYCPMAKIVRKELRKRKIKHLTVCYCSKEVNKRYKTPSSMIFAPAVAGLTIAHKVVADLLENIETENIDEEE